MPEKVLDLELQDGINSVGDIEGYERLHVLIRFRGTPIGWVRVANSGQPIIGPEQLREAIAEQLAWELIPSVLGEEFIAGTDEVVPQAVSVVVCTRDRPSQLAGCLQALLALDYPSLEIVIVDNAPRDDSTARLVDDLPVRYVREERPGLNWARNKGITEARHDIIAFTDNDARPDRRWLRAIVRILAEPNVGAVTGPVVPLELETVAQNPFEHGYGGGMSHGFHRRTVRRDALTTRELLWASSFGVGANMAFRREAISAVGRFDVALDAGTPVGGGGDVEMFHRLVARGWTLVYEPTVLVWHTRRRDMASLCRMMRDNGRSFGAYLLTCSRNRTVSRMSILDFAIREWLGRWLLRRLRSSGGLPLGFVLTELLGALSSPLAYITSQTHAANVTAAHAQTDAFDTDEAQRRDPFSPLV